MGWERRGSRTYYYLKKREGARVRSLYVGRGDFAQTCAEIASDDQQEQQCLRANKRQTLDAEAQIDRLLTTVEVALAAQLSAALGAAGYHKHKGQWRKKRYG
jgi:hypothetical protein